MRVFFKIAKKMDRDSREKEMIKLSEVMRNKEFMKLVS